MFQEGLTLNIINIIIIQGKYGISIEQTDQIMKNIIQKYWVTKTKDDVKFQKSPFPVDRYFEKVLFIVTPPIGEELNFLRNCM